MRYFNVVLILFVVLSACAQAPESRPTIQSEKFDQRLTRLLSFSVPVIGVEQLAKEKDEYIILDAREQAEYAVSHIEGARYLGYDKIDETALADLDKNTPIVLYCSVGYRSEKIWEKLKSQGFTNVKNLYGSIFEWINQGHPVVDNAGYPTTKIHTYNKKWSKWVEEGKADKVW